MKILIAAPTYLPSRRANTMQVMKMAQAIQNLEHTVRILVPCTGEGGSVDWQEFLKHYGLSQVLDIVWLKAKPTFHGYDYGYDVFRHFRRWGGQLLYTRLPQAAAWGSTMAVPTIYEVHDLPAGRMGPWLFKRFLKGRGARQLVVISQALRESIDRRISSLPGPPFTVIAPDGVDLARYERIPSPEESRHLLHDGPVPALPVGNFTIGYTGHLYEGRGISLILDIAHHLREFNFLLVGGDPQPVEKVKGEVIFRKLDNVFVTGFVSNLDLPVYQAACDVLLMPYQRQVAASSGGDIAAYLSPMKLFEYLACGRVILSSDLPVLREVLDEGNSILLPPENIDAWVEAIRVIRKDPSRQRLLGKQAREKSKYYSWESRAEKILSLSDKLLPR